MLLLLACAEPRSSTPVDDFTVDDTGEIAETITHCGTISGDETWQAGRTHLVTCDIEVERGVLTIGAGASVRFDERTGLRVGTAKYDAGLVVDGGLGGVTFGASGPAGWDGVQIGPFATILSIAGLTVRDGTEGVTIEGATLTLAGLGIDGAAGTGLVLEGGARIAEGGTGLVVTGSGEWSVEADVSTAHTLPSVGSSYTGNTTDGILLGGGSIDEAVEWENLGVPYVITETVEIGGTAGQPAILTLAAGVELLVEHDRQLRFSRNGNASQLIANGTEAEIVSFAALGAETAGYWRGIDVSSGASQVELHHVRIEGAGEAGSGALTVEGTTVWADHVDIRGSAGAGVLIEEGASFTAESSGLTVRECSLPLELSPSAVGSIPTSGLSLDNNTTAAVKISGEGKITTTGTWPDPGVPYWVADDINVDGTADAPATLQIASGVSLRFDNNTGIFVGKSGAAGLIIGGTADRPVTMLPWAANVAGAWSGVGIYDAAIDETLLLSHVEIGYAGGSALKGNLHVDDAAPSLTAVSLHNGLEWGLYLAGEALPILEEVTFTNNVSGDCNACP